MKKIVASIILITSQIAMARPDFGQIENTVTATPDIQQKAFQIGGRPQRVRFYLANESNVKKHVVESAPATALKNDPRILTLSSSSSYRTYTARGSIGGTVNSQDNYSFAGENAKEYGLAINPNLVMCGTDLLRMVKKVGDARIDVFEKWQIDEVNLFIKPVPSTGTNTDYKLSITPVQQNPKDPALNIQIPYLIGSDKCGLPTEKELDDALVKAGSAK